MKLFCTILCYILCSLGIQAQDQWVNYTNNFYVTDAIESDTELWISSLGGLCNIDTESGEERYYNRGNSDIPSNDIHDMILHPDGDLWITTSLGICSMNDDEFEVGNPRLTGVMAITPDDNILVANYDSLYIQVESMEFEAIEYPAYVAGIGGLEVNKEGTIFLNAINYFAETYVATYKDGQWDIIFSDFIYESSIVLDSQEKLWFASSKGLQTYQDNSWELITEIDSLDAFSVGRLFVDQQDNILLEIKSSCPKILEWNGADIKEINFVNGTCSDCQFVQPSTKTSNTYYASNRRQGFYSFTSSQINDFQKFSQSPIYYNSPLTTLHPNDGSHIVILSDKIQKINQGTWSNISTPSELNDRILYAGLKDDEMWICDNENLWQKENSNWNKISPPNDFTGEIKFMVIGDNGDIWIQTGTILSRYRDQNWQTFTASQHNITSGIIKDIAIDPENGDLWVSTFLGVRHYDGETWTTYDFTPVNHTFSIAISEEGVYVRKAGMFLIKDDGIIDTIPMPDIGYYGPFESEMIYDHENKQLYLSGSNHLAVLKDDTWTVYTTTNSGITNGFSNDLNIDNDQNLWISSSGGGLEVFNENGVVISAINTPTSNNQIPVNVYPTIVDKQKVFIETPVSGQYNLSLYDVQGNLLSEVNLDLQANEPSTFHIPQAPSGTYFIMIKSYKGHAVRKIIQID